MTTPMISKKHRFWLVPLLLLAAQLGMAGTVSLPNGSYSAKVTDLQVRTVAGPVSFTREYNGKGWRFNPHWDSLSSSFKAPLASSSGNNANAAAGSAGDAGGCWVWVEGDYAPSGGSVGGGGGGGGAAPVKQSLHYATYLPFNRTYSLEKNEPFILQACGTGSGGGVYEGLRRLSSLYAGDGTLFSFKERYTIAKQPVQRIPHGTTVSGAPFPLAEVEGYRWRDRGGDSVDYDDKGRIVSYRDRNDNTIWLLRNAQEEITSILDQNGKTLITLHYTNGYLTEVRDVPDADNPLDLPARTVKYEYDVWGRLVKATDVRGNETVYAYDHDDRLLKTTDAEGRVEQIKYDGTSTMVKTLIVGDGAQTDYEYAYDKTKKLFYSKVKGPSVDGMRRVEDYTHDRIGMLVKYEVNGKTQFEIVRDTQLRKIVRTDERGLITTTTTNEFEQPVSVEYPDGAKVTRSFDAAKLNLLEEIDELGIKTRYEYDTRGNLIRRIEAAGLPEERITQYTVNVLGLRTSATRQGKTEADGTVTPDMTIVYTYDGRGNVTSVQDGEGNTISGAYNRNGILAKHTDAHGNTWTYVRDAAGNLLQVADPLGRTRKYAYDKTGNLAQEVDGRDKAVSYAYDSANRLAQVTNPVAGIYRFEYNGEGLVTRHIDEDGRILDIGYDAFLRPRKETDGNGNVTEFQYTDGGGNLLSRFNPNVEIYPTYRRHLKFDARERPTQEVLLNVGPYGQEGLVTSRVYDKRGQVVSETDPNGKTRTFQYDAYGRYIAGADALGNTTEFTFDVRDNLIRIKDAKGEVTRFEYDRANRLTKEILPLGQTRTYSYDALGNVIQAHDPNGNRFEYGYDAAGRLTEARLYRQAQGAQGFALQETYSYTYDAADNLTAWSIVNAQNAARNVSGAITYDDANRITGETVTYPALDGATHAASYGATYSPAGKKTGLTYPDGTAVAFGYSPHGQLQHVTLPGEGAISVADYKWLAPKTVNLPGGTVQERSHDGLLKLTGLKVKTPAQQVVFDLQNKYDKVLALSEKSVDGQTVGYGYDAESRLTQVDAPAGANGGTGSESFTLDALANRIGHSQTGGAWQYDANNRLIQQGDTSYQYDANGNLIRKTVGTSGTAGSITHYGYDSRNRLVSVSDGNGALIAEYGYDLRDRRLWKDLHGNGTVRRTYYLYTKEGLIAESMQTAGNAPAVTTLYGWNPDNIFMSGPLFIRTQVIGDPSSVLYAYYHNDHLGTPLKATDKGGSVVWSADTNSFGFANIDAGNSVITSNLRLPGQYFDAETNLHYNWRRYYDPATGRYVTEDPIGIRGGINRYAYVEGNPLSYIDPLGLAACRVLFPDYPIDTGFGFTSTNIGGHGGVVTYDDSGSTRYYEYGRYSPNSPHIVGDKRPESEGNVRRIPVPDLVIDPKTGQPTPESMDALRKALSKKAGHNTRAELTCDKDADEQKVNQYAEDYAKDKNRPPYSWKPWSSNQCRDFANRAFGAGK